MLTNLLASSDMSPQSPPPDLGVVRLDARRTFSKSAAETPTCRPPMRLVRLNGSGSVRN